jgi:hypothetical protein
MKKTIIGIALLALAAGFGSACGGDDGGTTPTKTGSAGKGGAAGSGGPVYCAKEICKVPAGLGDVEACCMDKFSGGCGIMSGSSCRPVPTSMDDRCPVPDLASSFMIPGAAGTGGGATAGVVIVGCCTANNECGVDYGIGGCQPRSAACQIVPKANIDMIKPITCDGKPIDLPADCGSNFSFPGAGGAGGS